MVYSHLATSGARASIGTPRSTAAAWSGNTSFGKESPPISPLVRLLEKARVSIKLGKLELTGDGPLGVVAAVAALALLILMV